MDLTGPIDPKYIDIVYVSHGDRLQERRGDNVMIELTVDKRTNKILHTRHFENPLDYRMTLYKRTSQFIHGGS